MENKDLAGKSFLITGASSGIGRAVALAIVGRGASAILATRSEAKTRPLLEELKTVPGADVAWISIDLADLHSVERAASDFLKTGRPLDVLINNAGLAGAKGFTRDGFEITVGTNHLGPFLLTDRLLPRLRESPRGRLVNVSSAAHQSVKSVDWADFKKPTVSAGDRLKRYALSKLMNVVHARELARRLAGTSVTTYSLHPGVVASDVWRELPRLLQPVAKLFMSSNEDGAREVLFCATESDLAQSSGRYYDKRQEVPANPLCDDADLAAELFRRSEALISAALATSPGAAAASA